MQDFGGIRGQGIALLGVLFPNHLEYPCQFRDSLLSRWHQRIAAADRRYFRDPGTILLAVNHRAIVLQALHNLFSLAPARLLAAIAV